MPQNKKLPDNQITVYTPDGQINIEVLYANENIWLPQKRIAKLFEVDCSVVTKHLKNIFASNELQEDSVYANYAHTAKDYQGINNKQIRTLTRLRDTLLSRLMSGEVMIKSGQEEAGI